MCCCVPEWWGLVDYPKMRARKLAELGYIAMAIDMYGNGKVAEIPVMPVTHRTVLQGSKNDKKQVSTLRLQN
jgi:dienelactone hydrolase